MGRTPLTLGTSRTPETGNAHLRPVRSWSLPLRLLLLPLSKLPLVLVLVLLAAAFVAVEQKASWAVILLYCFAVRCRSDTVLCSFFTIRKPQVR